MQLLFKLFGALGIGHWALGIGFMHSSLFRTAIDLLAEIARCYAIAV
ncbi:MAG: hypothetical protein F6J93_21255 [Oscillatoria sp. SIO1A7]|nr:hypothetical protein [Oscillatoria sp. SIO1A7]